MNEGFRKICGLVNYKTYINVEAILFSLALCSGITNSAFLLNGVTTGYLGYTTSFLWYSYLFLNLSDGEYYTRDVNELKTLYQEFISNYNKLNKTFNLNEPISIYAMFNYLLRNGYLSCEREFKFQSLGCKNLHAIRGLDVINGIGVCRHVSAMLTDILNDYGIRSANLGCYLINPTIDVIPVDFSEYSHDENIEWIMKNTLCDNEREFLIRKLNILEENGCYVKIVSVYPNDVNKKLKKKIYGNHSITYSLFEGKNYYLDPTQSRIYRLKEDSDDILYDQMSDKIMIKNKSFRILNRYDKDAYSIRRESFKCNGSIDRVLEDDILSRTIDLCSNNLDVFDRFYSENTELYSEISYKLKKVKK